MTSRHLRWSQVIRKWCHLTESPGSACRRQKTSVYCTFHPYKAVARKRRQSRDRKWRHVTLNDRKWPGSDVIWPEVTWKWLKKAKNTRILYISHPTRLKLAGEGSHVSRNDGCDLSWPDVTWNWSHLTGSHLEVAVENQNLAYTVHFTSYKAVARRRRLSRDSKWHHVTLKDRKWNGSDVIWPEVTWKWQ